MLRRRIWPALSEDSPSLHSTHAKGEDKNSFLHSLSLPATRQHANAHRGLLVTQPALGAGAAAPPVCSLKASLRCFHLTAVAGRPTEAAPLGWQTARPPLATAHPPRLASTRHFDSPWPTEPPLHRPQTRAQCTAVGAGCSSKAAGQSSVNQCLFRTD